MRLNRFSRRARGAPRGRRRGIKWLPILLFVLYLGYYVTANREEVPLTGRTQLVDLSREQEMALGFQSYQQILAQERVITGGPQAELVQDIGRRIAAVSEDPGFEWEFNLIDSDQANAFCLPGGTVPNGWRIRNLCRWGRWRLRLRSATWTIKRNRW
jgi:Zn-dependent protease with chaperone function